MAINRMELLRSIEAYIRKYNIPAYHFGKVACNNPGAVSYLRGGGGISEPACAKMAAYLTQNPNGLAEADLPPPKGSRSNRSKGYIPNEAKDVARNGERTLISKPAQPVPGPSLAAMDVNVEPGKVAAIKLEAFNRRMPLHSFLAYLAELGWDKLVEEGKIT